MSTTPRERLHKLLARTSPANESAAGTKAQADAPQPHNDTHPARRLGAALVAGALVASLCPLQAIAATGGGPAGGTPPEKPSSSENNTSGNAGTPPDKPGEPPDGAGGGAGGPNTKTFDYTGTFSAALTADAAVKSSSGETLTATQSDQNAALAQNGGTLTLEGATLEKSGDDTSGDRCNFYGLNSVLLAVGQNSLAKVSATRLNSTSEGSNAIFATNAATVLANDVTITTSANSARGLDATYGGTILANNVNISTQGEHCAATATDRGGGSVSVTNSTLATSGSGSPLIYSTGNIQVSGTTGTATGSQIAAVEGLNTALVNDSTLESTRTGSSGSDRVANGVLIYQSTSGDAEATTGQTATFQATNSTLRSAISSGAMFYLTNTSADVVLSNTTVEFDSASAKLLLACGNSSNNWGKAGSNGATVRFTGINETLAGDIEADTISQADVYLTASTTWTGAAAISQNDTASTSASPLSVSVDPTSTWVVTKDSTISNLTVAEGGRIVDSQGKTVTVVAAGETKVTGDSDLTVTVNGTYSTSYDSSKTGTTNAEKIDRSGFDAAFGTSTAFDVTTKSSGSSTTSSSNATSTSESAANNAQQNPFASWWNGVVSFWKGLFGMA